MKRAPTRARGLADATAAIFLGIAETHAGREWPAEHWQSDPVGFGEMILGVKLWSFQVEFLEAIRDHARVAVAGGRKNGKDFAIAIAALWWYACFPGARVFMTAVTAKQVRDILYREIRMLYARSGRCAACVAADPHTPPPCPHSAMLTGKLGELPSTGLVAPDFREIKGVVAKSGEGMQGYSGARILALIDEASLYPEDLHTAIRGNLAADGCREVLIGNPTRTRGFFFDAFQKGRYKTIQVNSELGPNVVAGKELFPGLASRSWIEEQRADWGSDSAMYRIHVKGEFVLNEQGSIFPVHAITEAQARWAETKAEGQLVIGVDPAGEGGKGDESGFAARRGKKMLTIHARRGLTPDAHLVEVLGLLAVHGGAGAGQERPRVVVDREGETGAKVWGTFIAYVQAQGEACAFDLVGVRSSERAHRQPLVYDRVRDELCAVLADWFRDGGAIPEDAKLAKDLSVFRWVEHVSGRTKALSKDKIKEEIGRSPDRADAAALSCWVSRVVGATAEATSSAQPDAYAVAPDRAFDPYAAQGGGGTHDRVFDPYAR